MLKKVKLALRISHNLLDSEINETIDAARSELIRAGVDRDKANDDDDELISMAVKTYCLAYFCGDTQKAEKYHESWLFQLDNIRKTSAYQEA